MDGLRTNYQNRGSQTAGNRYLGIRFANTLNNPINYTFFQLIVGGLSSILLIKLPVFDDVMTRF